MTPRIGKRHRGTVIITSASGLVNVTVDSVKDSVGPFKPAILC